MPLPQGVADNVIGRVGGRALLEAIQSSESLERVCVYGNPFLTPSAAALGGGCCQFDQALSDEMEAVTAINTATRT